MFVQRAGPLGYFFFKQEKFPKAKGAGEGERQSGRRRTPTQAEKPRSAASLPTCKGQPPRAVGARKEPSRVGKRGEFHPQRVMRPQCKSSRGFHPLLHSLLSVWGSEPCGENSGTGSQPAASRFPRRPNCPGGRGWGPARSGGPARRRGGHRVPAGPAAEGTREQPQKPPRTPGLLLPNFGLTSLLPSHTLHPKHPLPSAADPRAPARGHLSVPGARGPQVPPRTKGCAPAAAERGERGPIQCLPELS